MSTTSQSFSLKFLCFLEYLHEVAVSNMADFQRLSRGGQIRRPKKKANLYERQTGPHYCCKVFKW